MRSALALGLLISLCALASAATVRHSRSRHQLSFVPAKVWPSPGWYKFPGYPPHTSGGE